MLMVRIARVIAPGFPHHVTQRGNRRQQTFFCDDDYQVYVDLLREQCLAHGVLIWGWCLMPNHAHLIAVPASETGLRLAIGNTHWRYTRHVNFREKWRGYLWQGRFTSCPLDEEHLLAAARYVDRNPVRAGLVSEPESWRWSSAASRILGGPDPLLDTACPLPNRSTRPWKDFVMAPTRAEDLAALRRHTRTGRPLGSASFAEKISTLLGRDLRKQKPGPKPKEG
jgi:putative transposase